MSTTTNENDKMQEISFNNAIRRSKELLMCELVMPLQGDLRIDFDHSQNYGWGTNSIFEPTDYILSFSHDLTDRQPLHVTLKRNHYYQCKRTDIMIIGLEGYRWRDVNDQRKYPENIVLIGCGKYRKDEYVIRLPTMIEFNSVQVIEAFEKMFGSEAKEYHGLLIQAIDHIRYDRGIYNNG